jgi:hypothetical protein
MEDDVGLLAGGLQGAFEPSRTERPDDAESGALGVAFVDGDTVDAGHTEQADATGSDAPGCDPLDMGDAAPGHTEGADDSVSVTPGLGCSPLLDEVSVLVRMTLVSSLAACKALLGQAVQSCLTMLNQGPSVWQLWMVTRWMPAIRSRLTLLVQMLLAAILWIWAMLHRAIRRELTILVQSLLA